jgi:alkylhydroperoxidase/carboxymuconolactone decarboxylase family protein YurZ
MTPGQAAAKEAFSEARGGWNPRFEPLARLTPAFLADYAAFSAQPAECGALSPKLREFIYIAIDGTATHLFEPGMRAHIRAALGLGAKPEEIAELLALISLSGINGSLAGLAAKTRRSAKPEG